MHCWPQMHRLLERDRATGRVAELGLAESRELLQVSAVAGRMMSADVQGWGQPAPWLFPRSAPVRAQAS